MLGRPKSNSLLSFSCCSPPNGRDCDELDETLNLVEVCLAVRLSELVGWSQWMSTFKGIVFPPTIINISVPMIDLE
jgi:hypothetical protein